MSTERSLYIGLMSGTSMDGVDAALVEFTGDKPTLLASHSEYYEQTLLDRLTALIALQDPFTDELAEADIAIGDIFATAATELIRKADLDKSQITAIGSHGQTIRHEPNIANPYSLQIGNAERIATLTGMDVIADFRKADIDAGGQGAPLAPAFHGAAFLNQQHNQVILNIGGIANITILKKGSPIAVAGFDTGPGNTLMDRWAHQHWGIPMDYDAGKAIEGIVNEALLTDLLADPYFSLSPPKSTGRELFNLAWLQHFDRVAALPAEDVQRTLCELSARSISATIQAYAPATDRVLICGGGAHNPLLMERLTALLAPAQVSTTMEQGIDPDWVEAIAFAWLAKQAMEGRPGNLPQVTGASKPVVLGTMFRS